MRNELAKYGYDKTEQICTEWNYFWIKPGLWSEFDNDAGEYTFEKLFNEASGIRGAAYSLAAMATFQKEGVAAATLHRADALSMYCTVFNIYGVPQRQYDAFLVWNGLAKLGYEISAESDETGLYVTAASDGKDICVAVSSYAAMPGYHRVKITGLKSDKKYRVTRFSSDEKHSLAEESCEIITSGKSDFGFYSASPSITMYKITEEI